MPTGTCKLCLLTKELKNSHVIPNAYFKRLFSQNSGKAVTFDDGENSLIEYTSDSWSEYLLCDACEKHLNDKYERYSISLLRGKGHDLQVKKYPSGVSFQNIDTKTLQLFLVSILWRAAISTLPIYSKVFIPENWKEELRLNLINNEKVRSSLISIKIYRLNDTTKGGYGLNQLKQIITSPFIRDNGRNYSFCLTLEGFFIEIFIPCLSIKKRMKTGVISPCSRVLTSPYLDVFSVPELKRIMVRGLGKVKEGKSKINR